MSTSNLLVPVHLDVLVVKNSETAWKDVSLKIDRLKKDNYIEYRGLGPYLEQDIPLSGRKNEDRKMIIPNGVHLHWTLPDSFRKGKYSEDGALDFPLAPNRWLVIRMDNTQRSKSWIVESDRLNTEKKAAYNWIHEDKSNMKIIPLSIGNILPFEGWTEKEIKGAVDLTIMAPGNPDFAASYMQCKNVFGFYDDMKDEKGNDLAADTDFTYQVFGWFSDRSKNPLAEVKDKADLDRIIAELSWVLPDTDKLAEEGIPGNIICHTMISSVKWTEKSTDNLPGNVKIGVGNSSSEALASLLLSNTKTDVPAIPDKLLGAYQYKALSDHGIEGNGLNLLKKQVHARSFLPVNGGTCWIIEAKPKNDGPDNADDKDRGIVPFEPEVSLALKELNRLQSVYDGIANQLSSQQAELYALKYKKAFILSAGNGAGSLDKKVLTAALELSISAGRKTIAELEVELKGLKAKTGTGKAEWPAGHEGRIVVQYGELQKAMTTLLPDHLIKEVPMPKFYEPGDPAVVITGLNPSLKYLDKDKKVNCRVKAQLIDKLLFEEKSVLSDSLPKEGIINVLKQIGASGIPAEIADLIGESFLLNPLRTADIAKILGARTDAEKKKIKILIENYTANPDHFVRNDKAVAYLPASFSVSLWEQPWNPLYLEWTIQWESSYRHGSNSVLEGWKFGDAKNSVDFSYSPTAKTAGDDHISYSGRVLLSSQLAGKVDELNKKIKAKLGASLFNDFVPMSQIFSGLNSQLLMRHHGLQLPILDKELKLDSDYEVIRDQYPWSPMVINKPFYPVRAGLLKLTMLRVIDSFGQVLDVFPGRQPLLKASREMLNSSAGMLTRTKSKYEFELAPRIIQPARLKFDWVGTQFGGNRLTDSDPATSPVCGWLLYNKLDKNISVYNSRGVELGILIKDEDSKKDKIHFVEAPGFAHTGHFTNNTLRQVVDFVQKNTASYDLIEGQIRAVTGKIQSRSSRQQFTMSLPIGSPVAIVNAQFAIEFKDLPAKDQSWDAVTSGHQFGPVNYEVIIGNEQNKADGISGYFTDNNYEQFNLPFGKKSKAAKVTCVTGKIKQLTLLMDPRSMVTIASGLLPAATYELPQHAITRELKNLNLRFIATPVISPADDFRVPLLQRNDISWNFIRKTKTLKDLTGDTSKSELKFAPLHAVEGWLKMIPKDADGTDIQ